MKIVFYSTYPVRHSENSKKITAFPTANEEFKKFCRRHPQDSFFCVYEAFSYFMPQTENSKTDDFSKNVICIPQTSLSEDSSYRTFVSTIQKLKPDLCIAFSLWAEPYDWISSKDALIKEELLKLGIKTVCNRLEASQLCFDKNASSEFFAKNGYLSPKSLFVNHNLFFCAGSNKNVTCNVYKEAVLFQAGKMNFPLIIKECTGLSSLGAEVVHTFGECKAYLESKKNNGDRIIQEYIEGRHFGAELSGDSVSIFELSLNKYGITSPKQSVKLNKTLLKKQEQDLIKILKKLKSELFIEGCLQADFILKDDEWYIIEMNPRLSGMTHCACAESETSVFERLYKNALGESQNSVPPKKQQILSIKMSVLEEKILKKIDEAQITKKIFQLENLEAKQEREKGYCELIFAGKNAGEIREKLCVAEEILSLEKNFLEFKTAELQFESMQK